MNGDDSFFVDTNLILYSVDAAHPDKQLRAHLWLEALWENAAGRLSWQVLQECYANAERKFRVERREARQLVTTLVQWPSVDMSFGLIQRAWHWMDQAQLAYWDGLILAAAEQSGCAWLLSEDFPPGRRYGTVAVINPFLKRPEEFGLKTARRH